jgi:hypothetical protein
MLMWPISLPTLRSLTSNIFPNLATRGDDAAAVRLGGRVYLPSNEFWIRGFWWIDISLVKGNWSDEQAKVRGRIFIIAFCIFVPVFCLLAVQLISHGIRERIAALVAVAASMPPALYAARRICIACWPALVQKADNDAVELINRSVPPRE